MTKRLAAPLVVLASTAAVLGALEIAFRILAIGFPEWTRPDPVIGWSFAPGAEYRFRAPEECNGWTSRGRINSLGLRDTEHAHAKPAGTYRILALGDSFTEAFQFPLEETWTKLLERRLNERGDGVHYEVINAGRSGMGTATECLFFENEGRRYEPDLVIVLFILNDFRDNSRRLASAAVFSPYFELRGGELALDRSFLTRRAYRLRSAILPFKRRSHLLSWVLARLRRARARRAEARVARRNLAEGGHLAQPTLGKELFYADPPPSWREAVEITRRVLVRLARSVHESGARFLLVNGTASAQVHAGEMARNRREHPDWDVDRPTRHLAAAAEEEGFPLLDLVPAFRERAADGTLLHGCEANEGRGHWNRAGHRLAAELIAEFLETEGMLPPPRPAVGRAAGEP